VLLQKALAFWTVFCYTVFVVVNKQKTGAYMYKAKLRKKPVSFTFNNAKFTVAVNSNVPACGYVTVLTQYAAKLVEEGIVRLYVVCNRLSGEDGRIYALFYNMRTGEFDGNFTVN